MDNPNQPTARTELNRCPLCKGECKTGSWSELRSGEGASLDKFGWVDCFACDYNLCSNPLSRAIQLHNSIKPPCVWDYDSKFSTWTRKCDGSRGHYYREDYCGKCGGPIQVKGEE